jgi:hypothetical protein
MNLIDLFLNIAGVFLWIDWRSGRTGKAQPVLSIASTVRPAERKRGQGLGSLAALLCIVLIRPVFYYSIGPSVNWTPTLDFIAISIPWRSDLLGRMYIFSSVSFFLALGLYYSWLLLLSAINRKEPDAEVMQRFVRGQLGLLEKLPWSTKILLPSIAAALGWFVFNQILIELELLPELRSQNAAWGQAAGFALAALLAWKWFLVVVFLLHLLNLYVFLGTHPLWPYLSITARRLLLPFFFLKFGRLDLAPLAGIAAVIALAEFAIKPGVLRIFQRFTL